MSSLISTSLVSLGSKQPWDPARATALAPARPIPMGLFAPEPSATWASRPRRSFFAPDGCGLRVSSIQAKRSECFFGTAPVDCGARCRARRSGEPGPAAWDRPSAQYLGANSAVAPGWAGLLLEPSRSWPIYTEGPKCGLVDGRHWSAAADPRYPDPGGRRGRRRPRRRNL